MVEVNKTKSQNSPTLKNSQKFVKWGQWFNTRSNSEKVINLEITDFSMYGDFLPKIDASFLQTVCASPDATSNNPQYHQNRNRNSHKMNRVFHIDCPRWF